MDRRALLQLMAAGVAGAGLSTLAPARAREGFGGATFAERSAESLNTVDLSIDEKPLLINGRSAMAVTVNGSVPGPIVRLREGQDAVLRVTNHLGEITSIHWHGVLLPPAMDGVPGVSFGGIGPGETFTYRFPVGQSGTYWAHSHSGGQELLGAEGLL